MSSYFDEATLTDYTLHTLAERPDLIREADQMNGAGWPEFMLHDPVADQYFGQLYKRFADYQVILLNPDGKVIACGNTIPITWDGTVDGLPDRGWDAVMELGVRNHQNGIPPTTLSAIQAVVSKEHLGVGLSQHVLKAMKGAAAKHGLKALVAPVRPNLKHRYPLTPMERYVTWKHSDGLPFDPWLRTHARLGATFMKVCPLSMTIPAKVADWEKWTEMRFPESGTFVIPGALNPIEIDLEADTGRYIEPNVWMRHGISD
ncbi:MAG: GNAT family N-acetyltransferase [Chloroflexota bacterium]